MTATDNVLLVTVRSGNEEPYEAGRDALRKLERDEPVEGPDRVTFPSGELLTKTFNERTLELLRTIAEQKPESIRATARLVDRDVKNVHEELTRLEALGVIGFVEESRSKRPTFPYDELQINVPFARPANGTSRVTS